MEYQFRKDEVSSMQRVILVKAEDLTSCDVILNVMYSVGAENKNKPLLIKGVITMTCET